MYMTPKAHYCGYLPHYNEVTNLTDWTTFNGPNLKVPIGVIEYIEREFLDGVAQKPIQFNRVTRQVNPNLRRRHTMPSEPRVAPRNTVNAFKYNENFTDFMVMNHTVGC